MAKPLDKHEMQVIVGLYLAGHRLNAVAKQVGRSNTSVRHVLLRRGVQVRIDRYNAKPYRPTPQEIAQETARIRDGWDAEEEKLRRGAALRYEFPCLGSRALGLT
jgi:hypothetical protein